MAKKKRRRSSRKPASSGISPVVAMMFGLAVGLSVAVAVYVKDRRPEPAVERSSGANPAQDAPTPASRQSALDDNGETAAAAAAGESAGPGGETQEPRFTFYDILPNFEVITAAGNEPTSEADTTPEAIVEPGVYVLQAGSFSTNADADRRRAELGLHGIESHIQRVKINDRNYHRVYIGPLDDLDELNMLRSRLRVAKIDVFRIRLSD